MEHAKSTNCLTSSMIKVGDILERKISFTHQDVVDYCNLAKDFIAIHHDIEAARLRFPNIKDIVVPGALLQISIAMLCKSLSGDGSLGLTFEPERVKRPVCPGDELLVKLELVRKKLIWLNLKLRLKMSGFQVSGAKSRVLLPDDSYRKWWETQNNLEGQSII